MPWKALTCGAQGARLRWLLTCSPGDQPWGHGHKVLCATASFDASLSPAWLWRRTQQVGWERDAFCKCYWSKELQLCSQGFQEWCAILYRVRGIFLAAWRPELLFDSPSACSLLERPLLFLELCRFACLQKWFGSSCGSRESPFCSLSPGYLGWSCLQSTEPSSCRLQGPPLLPALGTAGNIFFYPRKFLRHVPG